MTRTCSDCPATISTRSTGRCRSCSRRAHNRTDSQRAASSRFMKSVMSNPDTVASLHSARMAWCPAEMTGLNQRLRLAGVEEPLRRYLLDLRVAV